MNSEFIKHTSCDKCGSSDALAVYDDGHTYCFSCREYAAEGRIPESKPKKAVPLGEFVPLKKRKLTKETCQKFSYHVSEYFDETVQVANYYNTDHKLVAQKIRFKDKRFQMLKFENKTPLFGQHLWNSGGRRICVTEGEIDAMTVSQLQGHKWPVVSIPNGAQGAKKAFQENLEYLESFDQVVIMFDSDDPGRKAATECAKLLSFKKACIATLPLKDPNEMLQENRGGEIVTALWQAKEYKPSSIIQAQDTLETVRALQHISSDSLPYEGLNTKVHGIRLNEILTICAGSGIGKSQLCKEIGFALSEKYPVGHIALEESVAKTVQSYMSLYAKKPLHLLEKDLPDEELTKIHTDTFKDHNLSFYDHFGSLDVDDLLSAIRYLYGSLSCRYIILDHISIVVSGISSGDERRVIDNIMTQLRSLVEEIAIGLILVTHLKRPDGKGHEEGGVTSLSQLRGSAAIAQLSDIVIGIERDQQGDKPDISLLRVLKNRFSGETGIAGYLQYDRITGRMHEVEIDSLEEDEEPEF